MKASLNRLQQLSKQQLIALHLLKDQQRGAVAVVGIGCRFPGGADDPERYWDLIRQRRSTLGLIPEDRWPSTHFYDPENRGEGFSIRHGSFLDDVRHFDAAFFQLGDAEARALDPQHRLLLECGWHAIEDAAIAPSQLRGTATGVYIGLMNSEYSQCWDMQDIGPFHGGGISNSTASGRLSYLLDLKGPSMTLDTACSSSLVALHLACQSLISKECDVALAGGVNVMVSPYTYLLLARAFMLSPSGNCHTFDQRADGYARGEGCGMLLLKRLEDAVRDGDPIRAVIAGSASNQDGKSQGFSAPSGVAQQKVIQAALKSAGKKPEQIQFVECHGTGTQLGDPIELNALQAIYGKQRQSPLWLGAVKNNIGHTESAAGVAGLIKLVLALQHAQLPPQHSFNSPNPYFQWQQSALQVVQQPMPWPQSSQDLRVGAVSSFGIAGTNAHVIVQQAPTPSADASATFLRPWHVFTLSARDAQALQALAQAYLQWLDANSPALADVCHTLAVGRDHFSFRLAIVCDSLESLREKLRLQCLSLPQTSMEDSAVKLLMPFTASVIPSAAVVEALQSVSTEFEQAWQAACTSNSPPAFAWEYALGKLWMAWTETPQVTFLTERGRCIADAVLDNISLADAVSRYEYLSSMELPISSNQLHAGAHDATITLPMAAELATTTDSIAKLFETLAYAYRVGVNVQWAAVDKKLQAQRLHLPGYAFTRKYYWMESAVWANAAPRADGVTTTDIADGNHWHSAALAAFGAANTHALLAGKSYLELGIDSLSLMNFRKELEQRSGMSLSLTELMKMEWMQPTTNMQTPISINTQQKRGVDTESIADASAIAYRRWGDERHPVLLCLHGLFDTGQAWETLAPLLTAQGWQVLAPDLPGHGDSLRLPHYRPEEMSLSLLQWLDAKGIQPRALLAHSFGSIIATLVSQNLSQFKGPLFYLDPVWPFAERLTARQHLALLTQSVSPHRHFDSPEQAVQLMQSVTPQLPISMLQSLTLANLHSTNSRWEWKWDVRLKTLLGGGFHLTRQQYSHWMTGMSNALHVACAKLDDTVSAADRLAWRDQLGVSSWCTLDSGHHMHLALAREVSVWVNRQANTTIAAESSV